MENSFRCSRRKSPGLCAAERAGRFGDAIREGGENGCDERTSISSTPAIGAACVPSVWCEQVMSQVFDYVMGNQVTRLLGAPSHDEYAAAGNDDGNVGVKCIWMYVC